MVDGLAEMPDATHNIETLETKVNDATEQVPDTEAELGTSSANPCLPSPSLT